MSEQGDIGADEAALLESLREDLPSARVRERTRRRLAAAGVLAAGTVSSASAAAASGNALAGVPAGLVQKIAAWSWSGKVVLAATVCAGASAPLAVHMLTTPAAHVVRVERAAAPRKVVEPAAQLTAAEPTVAAAAETAVASSVGWIEPPTEQASAPAVQPSELAVAQADAPLARGTQPAAPGRALQARRASRASADLPAVQATPQTAAARADELHAAEAHSKQTTRAASASDLPVADAQAQQPEPATQASALPAADSPAPTADSPARQPAAAAGALSRASARPQPPAADELSAAEPAPRRSGANVFTVEPPRLHRAPLRPPPSTLAEETKLLERALAAVQVHDLAAARSWLSLHAARFHDGLLRRERENVWKRVTALSDSASH